MGGCSVFTQPRNYNMDDIIDFINIADEDELRHPYSRWSHAGERQIGNNNRSQVFGPNQAIIDFGAPYHYNRFNRSKHAFAPLIRPTQWLETITRKFSNAIYLVAQHTLTIFSTLSIHGTILLNHIPMLNLTVTKLVGHNGITIVTNQEMICHSNITQIGDQNPMISSATVMLTLLRSCLVQLINTMVINSLKIRSDGNDHYKL